MRSILCLLAMMVSALPAPALTQTLEEGLNAFNSGSYTIAFPILKGKAEQGDPSAQDVLAYMYENGWGTALDYNKAVYWYRKAAMQGALPSETSLGRMYQNGWGVDANYSYAAWWYQKAAEGNYPGAQDRLNVLLKAGVEISVPPEIPTPVRQAAVTSPETQTAPHKSRNAMIVQASAEATRAARPVWPSDMEPGNLYFLMSVDGEFKGGEVLMVAAKSAQEALKYAEDGLRTYLLPTARYATGDYSLEHRLIAGGQCTGPIWGAMVTNWASKGARVWGGGCGKTPALAIEAAFAACERNRASGCNKSSDDPQDKPRISLALSGSSPWSRYCGGCTPVDAERMGSFNSWSVNRYANGSYMSNAKESIAQIGKWCDEGSCFQTIEDWFCRANTPDCVDLRLTPNGLSGPRSKPKNK